MILRSSSIVLAVAFLACSRTPKSSGGDDAGNNPFVRSMAPVTARIVYEKHDGSLKEVFNVKNGRVRQETTGGMFAGNGYTISDGVSELRVLPKDRKVIRFRSAATHLFEEYRKLAPEAQAAVRRSIDLVPPDVPWYQEGTLEPIAGRDIHGLHASCFRRTSQILGSVSEECYWRGIKVWLTGKNPIDGSELRAAATEVELGVAVDDDLFAIAADFASEVAPTDEIMHGVYKALLERMQSPRFTLAHLDRHAGTP